MTSVRRQVAGMVAARRVVPQDRYPSAIAGHGSRSTAAAAADPLEINGILLEGPNARCLLVSFDLLYIGGVLEKRMRSEIATRHAFRDDEVLLFASHTHFAPPTDPALPALGPYDAAYADKVLDATLDLARELCAAAPQRFVIECSRGTLSHSTNRRRPRALPTYTRTGGWSFARTVMAPYAQGARDDTATVLTFRDEATGHRLAVLWHFTCHPVSHAPSNVTSADFPGAVRQGLRRSTDLPVLFLQGFCGDIRPNVEPRRSVGWARVRTGLVKLISGTAPLKASEESWRRWVGSLADKVAEIAAAAPEFVDTAGTFASAAVTLPVAQLFEGKIVKDSMHFRGARLGDSIEIIALGAEPSNEWQSVLGSATAQPTRIRLYVGYCGDVVGYLPTTAQLTRGGYEVHDSLQLFGLEGRFRAAALEPSVSRAVGSITEAIRANAIS